MQMQATSLNEGWSVEYFAPEIDPFEMAPSAEPILSLADWFCSPRFAQAGFFAWLQRRFTLEMTDYCVRYILMLEASPLSLRVYVNDQLLAEADGGQFELDITDFVSLGSNRLNLRFHCGSGAEMHIRQVWLVQKPCET